MLLLFEKIKLKFKKIKKKNSLSQNDAKNTIYLLQIFSKHFELFLYLKRKAIIRSKN